MEYSHFKQTEASVKFRKDKPNRTKKK